MTRFSTAVIADDEPLLRFHLDKLLAEVWPQLEVVASVNDGEQALKSIDHHQPDVVFLDIKMPLLDGMTLATRLNKLTKTPLVVFITAYDEYAVKAFEQNAVDYLLKPIDEKRLELTCQKLKDRLSNAQTDTSHDLNTLLEHLKSVELSKETSYLNWIKAQRGEDIHLISSEDVLYFKAEDKYISVFVRDEQSPNKIENYIIRSSLKELILKLNPDNFWQIHRSTVVNIAFIDKVKRSFNGQFNVVILNNELPVSRNAQHLFKGM